MSSLNHSQSISGLMDSINGEYPGIEVDGGREDRRDAESEEGRGSGSHNGGLNLYNGINSISLNSMAISSATIYNDLLESTCNGNYGIVHNQVLNERSIGNENNGMCTASTDTLTNDPAGLMTNRRSELINFPKLSGELTSCSGATADGGVVLTNYRIFISHNSTPISLPLGAIDSVELRDPFYLHIYTKYVRSLVLSFVTSEDCSKWWKRISEGVRYQNHLDDLYCFKFFKASINNKSEDQETSLSSHWMKYGHQDEDCWAFIHRESKRMGFDKCWRISDANADFKLCNSYPRYLFVPTDISDKDLIEVSHFRYGRRIPTPVWRSSENGCIIARSSQPEVGWLGWRNGCDENLLQALLRACYKMDDQLTSKKLLVLDARSYAAAVANRAKGGGVECPEYYPGAEVQFMALANIHSIRKSFLAIRYLCESPADCPNWLTLLDNSKWLNHIASLIKSAQIVVNAIHESERPVLVHCSDGWDRTPQIVALSEMMLDPYYRTMDGFRDLVQREWLGFGHKFADRCGNGTSNEDPNERSPIFLQWLDCVHQLLHQFPCSFQFSKLFLEKLALHVYSSLFGTFTCNNMHERFVNEIQERSYSVWSYLNAARNNLTNDLYVESDQVLRPSCKVKDMQFWGKLYIPSTSDSSTGFANGMGASFGRDYEGQDRVSVNIKDLNIREEEGELVKTRSCDNVNCLETERINKEMSTSLDNGAKNRLSSDSNLFLSLSYKKLIQNLNCDLSGTSKCVQREREEEDVVDGFGDNEECNNHNNLNNNHFEGEVLDDSDIGVRESSINGVEECEEAKNCVENGIDCLKGYNPEYNNNSNCINSSSYCNGATRQVLTTSTSTSELSSSQIKWDRCQTQQQSRRWKHEDGEIKGGGGGVSIGKHTRTPSSGCPASPNDEESPLTTDLTSPFDLDAQPNHPEDPYQLRLRHVISCYKGQIEMLKRELYMVRLALCQQINSDTCSKSTKSCSLDEHSIANENRHRTSSENGSNYSSLDTSWVNVNNESHHVNGGGNESDDLHESINCCDHSLNPNEPFIQFKTCRRSENESLCKCLRAEESSLAN